MLDEREAFLRAIFDAPDDDTPRLVYADWLDERGEADLAALIRVQCETERLPDAGRDWTDDLATREGQLTRRVYGPPATVDGLPRRGFLPCGTIRTDAALLADPAEFRRAAAVEHPGWFGATRLKVTAGLITGAVQVDTLLTAPAAANVTAFDLSGVEDAVAGQAPVVQMGVYQLVDVNVRPVITVLGVEAITKHRGARRLTELLLADNDLDNDAARFLVRSPYLIRLRRLDIRQGNNLRGETWAELLGRFGEDVVS